MALTANTPLQEELGIYNELPAAAANIFEGAMCSVNASTGVAGSLTLGEVFCGHSAERCDNSAGAAGDKKVKLREGRYRGRVSVTGATVDDIGDTVYATDNGTLTMTSGTNTPVGVMTRHETGTTCIVEFRPLEYAAVSQG